MKLTLLARGNIQWTITIWYTHLFLCRKPWKFEMQKQQWTRTAKSSRQFQHGSWLKSRATRRWSKWHKKTRKKVHLATLKDICHLRNAELEPKYQKYKGRFAFRGDTVKDDARAYAVLTDHGLSASQMTAAKVMDVMANSPDCDGQAADAVSAHTQVKMEDAPRLQKSECPDMWIRLPRHTWPKSWMNIEDPVVPLERNLYGHPLAGLMWETVWRSSTGTWRGKSAKFGMSIRSSKARDCSYLYMWTT